MADTKLTPSVSFSSIASVSTPQVGSKGNLGRDFVRHLTSWQNIASGSEVAIARITFGTGEYVPSNGIDIFNVEATDNRAVFVSRILMVGIDSGDTVSQSGWCFGRASGYTDFVNNRTVDFGSALNTAGVVVFADDSFSSSTAGDSRNYFLGSSCVQPGESFGVKNGTASRRCDSITILGHVLSWG